MTLGQVLAALERRSPPSNAAEVVLDQEQTLGEIDAVLERLQDRMRNGHLR